jgi:hypothetical protein
LIFPPIKYFEFENALFLPTITHVVRFISFLALAMMKMLNAENETDLMHIIQKVLKANKVVVISGWLYLVVLLLNLNNVW